MTIYNLYLTMNDQKIKIIDNKFEIIRYEGFGYVQNSCNYNKNIFNLQISHQPNMELEGGSCKTIYSFEIIKKNNSTKSIIEFVQDYSDYKFHTYYKYDSNINDIIILKQKKSKNKSKCIIL